MSRRLSTVSVVSGAVVAGLTAGPALGGGPFAERVQEGLSLDESQIVWQVLCLGALVVAVTAAVSAHLEKSTDLKGRVSAAEAAGAMLAGLEARLEHGGLAVQEAAQEYRTILVGVPFVPEGQRDARSSSARRDPRSAGQLAVVGLAVLLLVITGVGLVRGLFVAEQGADGAGAVEPGADAPGPTPPRPPAATSTGTAPPPPEVAVQGVFGGRAAAGGVVLAIVVDEGRAMACACDGARLEAWLTRSVVGLRVDLTSPGGAVLSGTFEDGAVSGVLRTPTLDTTLSARAADRPAGVYQAEIPVDGADARIGWAVLPDGQRGVMDVDGVRRPAPPLDLTDLTFEHDGEVFTARRLDA